MRSFWTRDFLTRRIDRCYLIAARAKAAHKRKRHLELARHYRRLLASMCERAAPSTAG
jgi:predicted YcjX-like family ATPase